MGDEEINKTLYICLFWWGGTALDTASLTEPGGWRFTVPTDTTTSRLVSRQCDNQVTNLSSSTRQNNQKSNPNPKALVSTPHGANRRKERGEGEEGAHAEA